MMKRRQEGGSITLEAIVGLTLLLVVFMLMVAVLTGYQTQMLLEDEAMDLVREAAKENRPAGTVVEGETSGRFQRARIQWGEHRVQVQVASVDGRHTAVRTFPREVP